MSDDYLWDRSGPPDPEIERLEQTLAPLRYRHRADLVRDASPRPRLWWAAAAAILLSAVASWQFAIRPAPIVEWQIAALEGTAHLGGQQATIDMPLRSGQLLRTGTDTQITLQADDVGQVDIGPDSELRADAHRQILLQRGLLHALIWARPGVFEVATPSARAIDLGCEYTIHIDETGDGLLRVATGWVAFQFGGRESFIPAGAQCVTRQRRGPGIPYYEDAPEPFRQALADFEAGDASALDRILASARSRDGLSLWHLLTRVPEIDRARVFDRFAQLIEVPSDVTRDGVIRKDSHMIDRCWDALLLENTEWWRGWERKW